jgi:hypothetical protein
VLDRLALDKKDKSAMRAIENSTRAASIGTTAASSREGRSLEVLSMSVEVAQEAGSRLWGELVVTEAYPDGTVS